MTSKTKELNPFERFIELNQIALRSFEQAARQSYEIAGEALELTIAQARAAAEAKDLAALATKQTELAKGFFEKQTERSQSWAKLAASTQAEVGKWAQSANEEFGAALRKTA
jgi:phasin family protein